MSEAVLAYSLFCSTAVPVRVSGITAWQHRDSHDLHFHSRFRFRVEG
jgi:hypothetical protein